MPATAQPPVYPTLAKVGAAIQAGVLDKYFFIQPSDDDQSCRLRYDNPNYDDVRNGEINADCLRLFVWEPAPQKIFEQCVSYGIPTERNPLRTGEESI